jgi:hypothetical protein
MLTIDELIRVDRAAALFASVRTNDDRGTA